MRIGRHPVKASHVGTLAQEFGADMPLALERARKDPKRLSLLLMTARKWAATEFVVDPSSPKVREATRVSAQASAALLALATKPPGESMTVVLGDQEIELPATGVDSTTHAGRWLDGIRFAVSANDGRSLDTIKSVPTDVVRASSTTGDEFVYLQVDAWRAFVSGDPRTGELLVAALDAADPGKVEVAPADFVLDQVVPELEVMARLMDRDAGTFNAALEKALKLHKKYWGKGSRKDDPAGFIAWGPTALARIALGMSVAVTVESDYVPRVLLEQ
jgi:hypothetical protein